MNPTRPNAYQIESVHLALLFARKAETSKRPLFTIDTLRRLIARESK